MSHWLSGFLPKDGTAAAWLALGIVGQIMFASRWLVQLIASEKRRVSTVPESFWWLSLVGGIMVLAYGLHARNLVIVLGQWGVVVYLRNLSLLRKERAAARAAAE